MDGELDADFDIAGAVDEIGSGLGFGKGDDNDDGLGDGDPAGSGDAGTPGTGRNGTGAVGDKPDQEGLAGKPAGTPAAASAASPAAPTIGGPPAAPGPLDFPKTWKPELQAAWMAASPELKAEIARREADMFTGLEQYKENAALGKPFKAALEPYMPLIQQAGLDPVGLTRNLLQAQHTLMTGSPEAKLNLIQGLLRDYRIELPTPGAEDERPFVDPQVAALRQELDGVKSQLSERQVREMREVEASNNRKIEAFAADTKNVHFGVVGHDMAKLISSGVCQTLEEAYEKAVWTNPVTRAAEISRQQAEAAAKAKKEDEERAAEARKATGANVRSRAKSGSAAAPLGSMDDTLAETLADIKSRG